jgi:TonB family protein
MTMSALLLAALSITPPSIAPPIVTSPIISPAPFVSTAFTTEQSVARFVAGEATCNGTVQQPRLREEPLPAGFTRLIRPGFTPTDPAPVALAFDVDASGRPVNIRRTAVRGDPAAVDTGDVAPAFSLWRFQPGAARQSCQIRFAIAVERVADAELPLLYRYLALQRPNVPGFNAMVGRAAFARIQPAGSNCRSLPSGAPREQHHPAFETIPPAPGTSSFGFFGFDIAADGTTRNVRVIHSDGNAELDRQSLEALAKWRFAPGARSGCVYSYNRRQTDPVPAPAGGPLPGHAPTGARCRAEPRWVEPLKPAFPPPFNRRSIEGWAVIGYDVAPWGETGNVRVIASEPAEQFGLAAASVIRRATKPASPTGFTGCVQRVRFVIARADGAPPEIGDD